MFKMTKISNKNFWKKKIIYACFTSFCTPYCLKGYSKKKGKKKNKKQKNQPASCYKSLLGSKCYFGFHLQIYKLYLSCNLDYTNNNIVNYFTNIMVILIIA